MARPAAPVAFRNCLRDDFMASTSEKSSRDP